MWVVVGVIWVVQGVLSVQQQMRSEQDTVLAQQQDLFKVCHHRITVSYVTAILFKDNDFTVR